MTDGIEQRVEQHYTRGSLERVLLDALKAAGKDPDRLKPADRPRPTGGGSEPRRPARPEGATQAAEGTRALGTRPANGDGRGTTQQAQVGTKPQAAAMGFFDWVSDAKRQRDPQH